METNHRNHLQSKTSKIEELEQCIICGTIINELDPDDVVKIEQGYLCSGCKSEDWFKKCSKCHQYEFEDKIHYIDETDSFLCDACYNKSKL